MWWRGRTNSSRASQVDRGGRGDGPRHVLSMVTRRARSIAHRRRADERPATADRSDQQYEHHDAVHGRQRRVGEQSRRVVGGQRQTHDQHGPQDLHDGQTHRARPSRTGSRGSRPTQITAPTTSTQARSTIEVVSPPGVLPVGPSPGTNRTTSAPSTAAAYAIPSSRCHSRADVLACGNRLSGRPAWPRTDRTAAPRCRARCRPSGPRTAGRTPRSRWRPAGSAAPTARPPSRWPRRSRPSSRRRSRRRSSSAIRAAHGQPMSRNTSRNNAQPSTPARWPPTVTSTVRPVPIRYSANPTSRAKPPATNR